MTITHTQSTVFTTTHARYMASKVASDLKRIQRYYGAPPDTDIELYEKEIVELIRYGYLGTVSYGFQRDGKWIAPTVCYSANDLNEGAIDDDPGRITIGADITGASFSSYLTHSVKWIQLPAEAQDKFKQTLPLQRTGASQPGIDGNLVSDKTYSSGGQSLNRSSTRNH